MLGFFPTPPAPPPPPAALTLSLSVPPWLVPVSESTVLALDLAALLPLASTLLALLLVAALARLLWHPHVPRVCVALHEDEKADPSPGSFAAVPSTGNAQVECRDPSTGRLLCMAHASSAADVKAAVAQAREAQKVWARSSFAQRRRLMRILSRCTLEHASDICRLSARDSGKTTTDAAFGEVLVTLEKLSWLCAEGEACLRAEGRSAGRMLFYKTARVEWHPRGVVGAIVPWNYPFHNVLDPIPAQPDLDSTRSRLNPISAALFPATHLPPSALICRCACRCSTRSRPPSSPATGS